VDGSSTDTRVPKMWALFKAPTTWSGLPMQRFRQSVSTSRSRLFQIHGVDAEGLVVIRRPLKRRYVMAFFEKLPSCLVGI
jgi:hypothetical protein